MAKRVANATGTQGAPQLVAPTVGDTVRANSDRHSAARFWTGQLVAPHPYPSIWSPDALVIITVLSWERSRLSRGW